MIIQSPIFIGRSHKIVMPAARLLTMFCRPNPAPKDKAPAIVETLRQGKYSGEAAIIGEVTAKRPGRVVVRTEIGAETLLPPPGGELLPRIC